MKFEQVDLDFDSDKKSEGSKVIPYAETLPKNGESDEEYAIRSLDLAKKIVNEEIVVEKPTLEDLNSELELARKSDKYKKNEIIKHKEPNKTVYDSTQAKINQMRSRKDLDY